MCVRGFTHHLEDAETVERPLGDDVGAELAVEAALEGCERCHVAGRHPDLKKRTQ